MTSPARGWSLAEPLSWIVAAGLLSPLVLYARAGAMPLAALSCVAAGIALCLMLVGRRLHAALLRDARSGGGVRQALFAAGMMLLIGTLVIAGAIVAVVLVLRSSFRPAGPVP